MKEKGGVCIYIYVCVSVFSELRR